MGSIWVKIAGAVVVLVLVIVILGRLGGDEPASQPAQKDKTFYDMADRDKQFGEEPKAVQEPKVETAQQPVAQEPAPTEPPAQQPAQAEQQPAAQVPGVVLPSSITAPTTLYFKPLDETEQVSAEQTLPWAVASRSIGRLPMMQYGPMVKACRDILQRWPESWYAFRAKQMLEEVAERHAQYNITQQELDISRFLKPRRGTEPREVKPVR
ncbi:MAG TPA: hypothetical protein PKH24_16110 [Sedimentisphaerales bacterium]|jgi:hypothetical protein|nr:hypothetical protein [Sedimentisphaerales bacterium]HNU31340.1 hypothetical protein [Sedimentisphaerales bacterium]